MSHDVQLSLVCCLSKNSSTAQELVVVELVVIANSSVNLLFVRVQIEWHQIIQGTILTWVFKSNPSNFASVVDGIQIEVYVGQSIKKDEI